MHEPPEVGIYFSEIYSLLFLFNLIFYLMLADHVIDDGKISLYPDSLH